MDTEGQVRPDGSRGQVLSLTFLIAMAVILILPEILRQTTGNDYMRYVEFFHLASIDAYVPTEKGFNLAVKALYNLCGYENYLLVFALFAILTVAFFLAAIYQQADHLFFTCFLFLMFGYYFQSYNTVRYYFALAMVIYSLKYFLNREYFPFLLLVLFASSFHKSSLVVLALYPAAMLVWNKIAVGAMAVFGVAFFIFQDFWMKIIIRLYPSYEDSEILAAGGHLSSGNIARCGLILAAALYLIHKGWLELGSVSPGSLPGSDIRKESKTGTPYRLRFYLGATLLAFMIYVFGWFVPEVSRICYFLTVPQIFLLPMMVYAIPEKKTRKLAAVLVYAAAVLLFAFFLRSSYDIEVRILPYHSFLFYDLPLTPSRSI